MKTTFTAKAKAKKFSAIPGDTRMVLTSPAVSKDGAEFPRGTVFQPISAGTGGQDVSILRGDAAK
jgi:hypothetical protein